MGRSITAREATVRTATVDVKALTISGKQVTLSVFRQLKDEDVVDADSANLRGVPWGIVNYFWGECAKSSPHLHVVWQKGDELRRACAWPSPERAIGWKERREDVDNWFQAWVLLTIAETGNIPLGVNRPYKQGYYKGSIVATIGGIGVIGSLSDDEQKLLEWKMPEPQEVRTTRSVYIQGQGVVTMDLTEDELDAERARVSEDNRRWRDHAIGTRDELIAGIRQQASHLVGPTRAKDVFDALSTKLAPSLISFEKKWRDQYAALASLDHLFIAV